MNGDSFTEKPDDLSFFRSYLSRGPQCQNPQEGLTPDIICRELFGGEFKNSDSEMPFLTGCSSAATPAPAPVSLCYPPYMCCVAHNQSTARVLALWNLSPLDSLPVLPCQSSALGNGPSSLCPHLRPPLATSVWLVRK